MAEKPADPRLLGLTAQIVAAHAANTAMESAALPMAIREVYKTLATLGQETTPRVAQQEPAVPIHESVFPDYIVCLEDGKAMKMLKRHLLRSFNMTPEQYRRKWGLDPSYPMVAPNYAEKRSALAKQNGLGQRRVSDDEAEE
ncbi:MAG TPA: MucR family transcriptional regulator [Rhodopila sp.]|uniref:MucR family transcriptional regulator n=1 Tax=Rhodopila sp. TaxID=2480087 RepID=UPI002C828D19|nr:MucR family transcriptional regulator [Rhodopila sp.]HVY17060.1 MucR family transcriptional regulator [Rhodopila sp.]